MCRPLRLLLCTCENQTHACKLIAPVVHMCIFRKLHLEYLWFWSWFPIGFGQINNLQSFKCFFLLSLKYLPLLWDHSLWLIPQLATRGRLRNFSCMSLGLSCGPSLGLSPKYCFSLQEKSFCLDSQGRRTALSKLEVNAENCKFNGLMVSQSWYRAQLFLELV